MLRFADSRRGLAGLLATTLLVLSIATPAAAGDDLIVRPGDTLWDIANEHNTTVAALVALNRIENPSLIRIGQRIVLRPPVVPATAPSPAPEPPAPIIHVVRPGDTLWDIAVRYRTTVAVLVRANDLDNPSLIRIGQTLAIPQPAAPAAPQAAPPAPKPPTPAAPPRIHVVQHGETLWAISARYGVSIQSIVDANGLTNVSFIRTGQRLAIPGAPAAAAGSAGAVTNSAMSPSMAAKVTARAAWRDVLLRAAREFGVPEAFVLAVAWHESGWQPAAVSSAGAVGLMQLMPDTADWVADSMLHEPSTITDPQWNARAGARLLAFYLDRYGGNRTKTLAAYFQGMTSVDQIGVLVSSQPYIDSILSLEAIFSR